MLKAASVGEQTIPPFNHRRIARIRAGCSTCKNVANRHSFLLVRCLNSTKHCEGGNRHCYYPVTRYWSAQHNIGFRSGSFAFEQLDTVRLRFFILIRATEVADTEITLPLTKSVALEFLSCLRNATSSKYISLPASHLVV